MKEWSSLTPHERREETLAFVRFIQKEIPGCTIHFKDDPPETIPVRDRVLHFFARIFTPEYDTRYTTVMYPRIYFPVGARPRYESSPESFYTTLRHEFVHLKDFQRFHLWMAISYVLILPLGWTMRAFWEERGYAQNMICTFERDGHIPDTQIERLVGIFSGRGYFFMQWPAKRARRRLLAIREKVLSGELRGVYPYGKLRTREF